MSNVAKLEKPTPKVTGLDLLRQPFPAHQISKLPKPTKAQTEEVKANFKAGIRCQVCGSWHHPAVVHLDYVGHAALTDRLLDADPLWSWEPAAFRDGLPAFDATGGLWIKLTVCGVSRLGYGHAASKAGVDPGAREKEVIGDALRNAAMRFGAALDLWHKGDLHVEANDDGAPEIITGSALAVTAAKTAITSADDRATLKDWKAKNGAMLDSLPAGERDEIVRYFTARWNALGPVRTQAQEAEDAGEGFRPGHSQSLSRNGGDVSAEQVFS